MKAVVLFSGGLDSILALKIILGFGAEATALEVATPFTDAAGDREKPGFPERTALSLGAGFMRVESGREYLDIIEKPKFGYGKNLNPCIDCKIYMLKTAASAAEDMGASFIATGDVLGQRPMSQNRQALKIIDESAGLAGRVLRPLSARLLEETIPEQKGIIDRGLLFSFSGRSRKPQIELARKLGITDYPNASGGCLLTSGEYARKVKDLIRHRTLRPDEAAALRTGRHFRVGEDFKLIVGRNEAENRRLEDMSAAASVIFLTSGGKGPVGLGLGEARGGEIETSAGIMSRYASGAGIIVRMKGGGEETLSPGAFTDDEIEKFRI